ncbi:KxYKxGKxW signal peptide domain-containing protein [Weissella muntiaci]|nr:KxYKxGKxW signal peptide domain-containing protein [Weissella muntiaci]
MNLFGFKRNDNVKNTNFKMYMSGKNWVFALVFLVSIGIAKNQDISIPDQRANINSEWSVYASEA